MEVLGLSPGTVAELKRIGPELKEMNCMTVAHLLVIQDAYAEDEVGPTNLCKVMGVAPATINKYMAILKKDKVPEWVRVDWLPEPRVERGRISKLTQRVAELEDAVTDRDDRLRELLSADAIQRERMSWLESPALTNAQRERDDVALTLDPSKGDFVRLEGSVTHSEISSAPRGRRSLSAWRSWRRR
jgi:hypothetical protein